MKIAMVWNIPTPSELVYGGHIGTHSLHCVVGIDAVWWRNGEPVPDLSQYDCLIIHLFADMQHVMQIRAAYPSKLLVALPDVAFDELFLNRDPALEGNFMAQLKAADVIGYVSESNRQFYSAFDKPMVKIPMPIGTHEFFQAARLQPKEDFIISSDHSPRVVDYTIQNVAGLAMIQRKTGLKVLYCNPGKLTPLYAEQFGLKADFLPKLSYGDYVMLAARARLGVDLYARYGFGRNGLTLAYAGTLCLSSRMADAWYGDGCIDPWYAIQAGEMACEILNYDAERTERVRIGAIHWAKTYHSFIAVREQWVDVTRTLEKHMKG